MASFTLGKTLDNTIYKTDIIRAVGGFPKLKAKVDAGVDVVLAYEILRSGFQWVVDYTVQSVHTRKGLPHELKHKYWYGTQLREIWRKVTTETGKPPPITQSTVITRFIMSPFTGVFMAIKTREPTITYIHPLIRLYFLKGLLVGATDG